MEQISAEARKNKIYHVTIVGFVVNLLLSVGKLLAGVFGRSGAMVADAIHSISDMATDVVVLVFARVSAKPKDDSHHYGHGKFETLASLIISIALAAVGSGILIHSIKMIGCVLDGEVIPRPALIALLAAIASIAAKEALYWYTIKEGRRLSSPSVIANAWHHRSDALSSLGTLVGIGCAYFLGEKWRIADPIAALVVSVFIFKVAFDLIRTGVEELMEKSLPEQMEREIIEIITSNREVMDPHNLRTRRIGSNIAIEIHIRVDSGMSVFQSHQITVDIENRLRERYGCDTIISIHVEPCQSNCCVHK